MAIHICRDFLTTTTKFPSASMYLSSIFLMGVLGYTQVGHTDFNLNNAIVSTGVSASINFGTSGTYSAVGIPSASHIVTALNIGSILTLRSDLYPRHNSGLFRIQSIDAVNNRYIVDYRAAENPPVETNTLTWKIWVPESIIPSADPTTTIGSAPNGTSGYQSRGSYIGKRIIMQSPHSSSWQVRYCYESSTDRNNFNVQASVAPGFNGDAAGDFPAKTFDTSNIVEHLHGPMYFDTSFSSSLGGSAMGIEAATTSISNLDAPSAIIRFYAWGDSVSGSALFLTRGVSSYGNAWHGFGLAEEDAPLPKRTAARLFVFGRGGGTRMSTSVRWDNGPAADMATFVSFGDRVLAPVSCVFAMYDYIANPGSTGIKAETLATDNALLGYTELQKVDMYAGTIDTSKGTSSTDAIYDFEPRRIGSVPIARIGRSNFGTWSLTNDASKSWFHALNGVFLPWTGPAIHS